MGNDLGDVERRLERIERKIEDIERKIDLLNEYIKFGVHITVKSNMPTICTEEKELIKYYKVPTTTDGR